MQLPYLTGSLREAYDAWQAATYTRHVPPLTFTELRKGVQALSSLYVERRAGGNLATRSIEGTGKRGALATYYAGLHFLIVHHAMRMVGLDALDGTRRVIDLGCGTGAVGAAIATALAGNDTAGAGDRGAAAPELLGIDRSGWALEESERTWLSFGLRGRAQRSDLPEGFPRGARGVTFAFGWSLSEFDDGARAILLRRLVGELRRGARVMIVEPLSKRISPFWPDWAEKLGHLGVADELIRVAIDRPPFIRDMDKAARLDHQVIGARVLVGGRKGAAVTPAPIDDPAEDDGPVA